MFCPDCGTWNRTSAATCARCSTTLPEVADAPKEKPDDEVTQLRVATGSRYKVQRRLGGGGIPGGSDPDIEDPFHRREVT